MHVASIAAGDLLAPEFAGQSCPPLDIPSVQEADLPPHITRSIHRIITWREGMFASLSTNIAKIILVEILRCTSWKHPDREIRIGNTTLALRINRSIATVKRALKALEEGGWLSREQQRSATNKFMGSNTFLSRQAIECLGLEDPLIPVSPFFRGSGVSPTIGGSVIQSSTKRQQSQQAASGPSEISATSNCATTPQETLKIDSEAKQPLIKEAQESVSSMAPAPNRMIEPKLFCRALNGNTITLPKTLEPLLQRLAPHQICRLMGDARRAGHRLEDISIACEKPILAAKSPMAYLRRLIACNKDWAWIRDAGQRQAAADAQATKEAQDMATKKAAQKQFQHENAGRYFMKPDRSRLYHVDNFSCTEWSMESGRSGNMAVTEKFITAVQNRCLINLSPVEAREIINRCKATASTTRCKTPSPTRFARNSFSALADIVG